MEFEKEDKKKLELIHVALRQLKEETKRRGEEDDDGSRLLSRLLSKLDSLEKDTGAANLAPCTEEPSSSTVVSPGNCETDEAVKAVKVDEIVIKELRRLRRQNLITHCLLLLAIGITSFWQFSEVSLLLAVKQSLNHPIRAVGDMIQGALKKKDKKHAAGHLPIPTIAVPELPHIDLQSLDGEE